MASTPIDPKNITNFSRSVAELQKFWLYCIVVAGRNSDMASNKIGSLLEKLESGQLPFDFFQGMGANSLHNYLVAHRVGQYARIERAIRESLGLDLRTCTLGDLLSIYGVGNKTARFFLLHTRPNVEYAVLDTHLLKWLVTKGIKNVPKVTPQNPAEYLILESLCIAHMKSEFPGVSLADADLMLWTQISNRLDHDAREIERVPYES